MVHVLPSDEQPMGVWSENGHAGVCLGASLYAGHVHFMVCVYLSASLSLCLSLNLSVSVCVCVCTGRNRLKLLRQH